MKKELILSYWEGYLSISLFLQKMRMGNKREQDIRLLMALMNSNERDDLGCLKTTMLLDWICIIKAKDIMKDEVDHEECYRYMIKYMEHQEKKFALRYRKFLNILQRAYIQKTKNQIWKHWIDSCKIAKA